jgi:uncharacterized protein (DUF885 family)
MPQGVSGRRSCLRFATHCLEPIGLNEENSMKISPLILSIVVLIPVLGWAQSPSDQLKTLLEEEWEYNLRESPTMASSLGDKRYNDRWPDVSLEAIAKRYEHQRELLRRLTEFDSTRLTSVEKLNLDLFRRQVDVELEEYPYLWHLVPLNQRDGIQDESSLAGSIPFLTV